MRASRVEFSHIQQHPQARTRTSTRPPSTGAPTSSPRSTTGSGNRRSRRGGRDRRQRAVRVPERRHGHAKWAFCTRSGWLRCRPARQRSCPTSWARDPRSSVELAAVAARFDPYSVSGAPDGHALCLVSCSVTPEGASPSASTRKQAARRTGATRRSRPKSGHARTLNSAEPRRCRSKVSRDHAEVGKRGQRPGGPITPLSLDR